jgi:hypothetical protein
MEESKPRTLSLDKPIDSCIINNISPLAPREKNSRLKIFKHNQKKMYQDLGNDLDQIIQKLKNIITLNEEIKNEDDKESEIEIMKYIYRISTVNDEVKKKNQFYENKENKLYYEICEHMYVDDYIDITPDKSQRITYCINCFEEKR